MFEAPVIAYPRPVGQELEVGQPSARQIWAFGAWLGAVFLLATALRSSLELAFVAEGHKVLTSVAFGDDWGTALPLQLGRYALTLLAAHVALGVIAASMTILTLKVRPTTKTRHQLLTVFWFALYSYWILSANAIWFPASLFAQFPTFLGTRVGSLPLLWLAGVPLGAATALAAVTLLWQHRMTIGLVPHAPPRAAWIAAMLVISSGLLAGFSRPVTGPVPAATGHLPNIIVIGIDSLRRDLVDPAPNESWTPELNRFLAGAHVFEDTVTPLARTFPAWVSILTGNHPVTTNARFNLMPRTAVDAVDTLGHELKRLGYRSVYATDEVRFANIDESYGFDETVTPPIGAADFILGSINDLPLPNVLSRTRLGSWLFPHTYSNRAAAVTYRPETFVEDVANALPGSTPLFLAVHLTLAHVPYTWAGLVKPASQQDYRPSYDLAIAAADRQLSTLLSSLEAGGFLNDAIVVLLSDHGEALGAETDTFLRAPDPGAKGSASVWGHGTSVMSWQQFQVVLAFREFGTRGRFKPGTWHDEPASLEDVTPTLMDLVLPGSPPVRDGQSLAPLLSGSPAAPAFERRVRFTETGFNPSSVLNGDYDAYGALQESAAYYEIDPESGWVQLKEGSISEMMRRKERAGLYKDLHLAALQGTGGKFNYYLTRGPEAAPVRIDSRPDPLYDADGAYLWDALHTRFAGEMP